jgi:hypothetical protein
MARFIVGTTMKIQPASSWAQNGALRNSRKPPGDATVIALDPLDAARLNLKPGQKGLYLLYDNLPIAGKDRGALPFNPSALPFLSQRMLIVLCKLEPEYYSFYQRRLAEFQSRLESAVEVGRSLIGDVPLLDLSGSTGPWISAAAKKTVRPPDDLWTAWSGSTRTPELTLTVQEAESRGWWTVTDAWTPAPIKSRATGSRTLSIPPPAPDYDFFTYLHDIYLQIWTASR